MMFDPNLGQDVIIHNTPLRKQIFVDPGIRVNRFTAEEDITSITSAGGAPGGKFLESGSIVK